MSCSKCRKDTCQCNPCCTTTNTVACETLPSQIENFTKQFFGSVVKTEVNGVVTWTLPCNLETGFENNPRLEGEGVGCYLLRLLEAGIIGLTGPAGNDGTTGADGFNSYTVTLAGFTQPTSGNPNVTVITAFNPAIVAGLEVFIATSGWYLVQTVSDNGTLFLTLTEKLPAAIGTITAGKLVIPTGPAGRSIVGPQGDDGIQGEQGTPGVSFTQSNDMFFTDLGVDYALPVVFTRVDFNNAIPEVLLPAEGTYLITATVPISGEAGVLLADSADFLLRDTTISADLSGSEKTINNFVVNQLGHIVINVIYDSDSPNHTVALFGKCTTAGAISVVALQTTITFVRIA